LKWLFRRRWRRGKSQEWLRRVNGCRRHPQRTEGCSISSSAENHVVSKTGSSEKEIDQEKHTSTTNCQVVSIRKHRMKTK
jgi:hypothetical protein